MTPPHPHQTPPPAADTVAPVTVARTYRERVEALTTLSYDAAGPDGRADARVSRGQVAEIAAAADARIAELEAALPDPRVLENIAATRGQLNYDASDALRDAADATPQPQPGADTGAERE